MPHTARPYAVKYDRLGAYLVPEVQEQRDCIDELKRENGEFLTQLAALEDHVGVTLVAVDGGAAEPED